LDPDLEPAEDLLTAGVEDLDLGEEAFLGLDAFRGEDALEAGEAGFFLGGIWEGGIGVVQRGFSRWPPSSFVGCRGGFGRVGQVGMS
jgi:hypothetical protein